MDLTIYDIIIGPRITEKSYGLNQRLKQLVLNVHIAANKPMIVQALKKLFNVEVDKITTRIRKGKLRKAGRRIIEGKTIKIATVTLKEGYSMDVNQLGSSVAAHGSARGE